RHIVARRKAAVLLARSLVRPFGEELDIRSEHLARASFERGCRRDRAAWPTTHGPERTGRQIEHVLVAALDRGTVHGAQRGERAVTLAPRGRLAKLVRERGVAHDARSLESIDARDLLREVVESPRASSLV